MTFSITIDADLREFRVNDKKILIGVVSGKDLIKLKADIPNTPNPREYMGRKNKFVAHMKKTLREKPELFIYTNSGIDIIAESYIRNDDGTITLFFSEEDGIFNGNHTKNVLINYGSGSSYVIVAVYIDVPKEEIVDIIIGKNSSTPTKEISRGEKLGRFEWVKDILPNYPIKYKESDDFDLDITTILNIAGIFQVDEEMLEFEYQDQRRFKGLLRQKGEILKKHNSGRINLEKTRYILKDLVDFYLTIRSDEECVALVKRDLVDEGKKGPNGWISKRKGGVIKDSLMFNILNALNFAFYIHEKTYYPCFVNGYDAQRLIGLTRKVFPLITTHLKKYVDEGWTVTDICREKTSIYQEIQNFLLMADLKEKNELQQRYERKNYVEF